MALAAIARLAVRAVTGYKFGKEAYRLRGLGTEDPRGIIADAGNPDVPVAEVLARAAARSRTGHLMEVVQERLATRPGGLAALERALEGQE
jgi:hypothetical protein